MLRKSLNLLKTYVKVQIPCRLISSRVTVQCLNTKRHISYNNNKIQVSDFHETVIKHSQLSLKTLEENIINFCICLRNGRNSLEYIEPIIEIYEKTDHKMRNNIDLLLLRSCGELLPNVDIKTRQMLTKRVWDVIQKKDCELMVEHYEILLDIYEQNSELINPNEFLSNMKVKPNESIYCSLLNVATKTGDIESVSNIMSKLKENKRSWDQNTYNRLIELEAMQGNITKAYNLIEQMKSCNIEPSSETYIHLAYGLTRIGNIADVIQICEKNQPSTANVMKIIKILISNGYREHISSILKFLPGSLDNELSIINNTIIELAHSGQTKDALEIISYLPTDIEILEGCIEFVKCFVSKEIQLGTSDENILLVIHKFKHNKYLKQIINEATIIALCQGRETLALTLFENMRENNIPIRPHYYWPLLSQAHKSQDEDKIYSLFSHMISMNVEIDNDTLSNYVWSFVDKKDPIELAKKIISIKINYNTAILSLAAFLLRNNRLTDVISMLSKFRIKCNFNESYLAESLIEGFRRNNNLLNYVKLLVQVPFQGNPPYLYILNALLNNVNNSQEKKQLIEFLEALEKCNVTLSTANVNIIKERIDKTYIDKNENDIIRNLLNSIEGKNFTQKSLENTKYDKSQFILSNQPHPANMDIKQLEAHVIELQNKKMSHRGTLKKLLEAHCKKNNLKAAEEVKAEIFANNFEWTAGMSASLFLLYVKNNLLDKAEMELNEIKNNFSNFKVDSSKILSYAICLVENNRLKDAFDVINNFTNVNQEFYNGVKCHWLLRAISKYEDEGKMEEMIIALVKKEYITIETNLLAPFVMKHLINNDIDSAIKSFEYCAKKYRKCPLKQKLLLQILEQNESLAKNERLLRVLKCIEDVHDEQVAAIQLVMAFTIRRDFVKVQQILESRHIDITLLRHNILNHLRKDDANALLAIFENIKNKAHLPKKDIR